MLLPDFYRIRPFARKAGVKVRVREKLGLPFFLYRNRKRKLFTVGLASFFLLLFVLSRFIWNISFSGNLHFTDDMLTRQLREIGICYGMPKSGVDCDRIEEELRSRCPQIVWVSAHVAGTRLQIRVRENETAGGDSSSGGNTKESGGGNGGNGRFHSGADRKGSSPAGR